MEKMIYAIVLVKRDPGKLNALLIGMKSISGADLYAVSFGEISAVVSEIKRAELITDKANAIAFAGVIENLAQQFTLLPMRFGSMIESTDAVIKMLEKNYNEIQQNLQKVENKYEFGLKIFCDPEKLNAELRAKSEANTKAPDYPTPKIKNSVFRDFVNRKLKEHRLEELLLSYVDSVIAEITGHLAQLNTSNKFKKMVSEKTILDAIFLIENERKDALVHVIEDLQNQYPALNFVLTGPWPPYNFVETTIK